MNFEAIIGLEIHVEMKTKSKIKNLLTRKKKISLQKEKKNQKI